MGRPNVGKSTLFNRICGRRRAIVDRRPGSTRDRNYAQVERDGRSFELVDTGGLLLATDDPLLGPASDQARAAIREATLVVLVVDGRAGLLPDDEEIARQLRRESGQVIVAVNKVEGSTDPIGEFPRLGFETLFPVSAEHAHGVGELLEEVLARLPDASAAAEGGDALPVALVGRPNVGKSSLLNRLLRAERSLVSPVPGTTRDAVDSLLELGGRRYRLVDTAGIRRVRALKESVDHVSVVQARRSLERASVALLVTDASEGIREMDATIGGYAHESGRGVVIVLNKWDLVEGAAQSQLEQQVRDELKFLAYAPIVATSAATGKGIKTLFKRIDAVAAAQTQRVNTAQLNRVIERAVRDHAPPSARAGKPVRILYCAQIGVLPPTFALTLSQRTSLHFSYRRFLENRIRQAFGFGGTPIVLKLRTRRH